MSDLPVFFAGLAEEDIDQIEDYIASRDPAAASRVRIAIVQQAIRLGKIRKPASERQIGVRLWPVPRYRNYMILYRIEPTQIRVLRILHGAQNWTRFFK